MPFFSARPTAIFTIRARRILPFLFRQIITTGYVAAGYANNVPWRNVNSMNHATDTTTNRGDLLQEAANYTSGAHNKNNAFIWGTDGIGPALGVGVGAFNKTSCFNMRNNTTLTKTPSMNTAGVVGDSGTMQDHDGDGNTRWSWQNGSQASAIIQKFNLTTEVHQGTQATTFPQGGIGASAMFTETFGYWWEDTQTNRKFTFATETESTPSFNPGWHSQQQGTSSKVGKGYAGNEGSYNGGNSHRVTNFITEVSQGLVAKPIIDSGEENLDVGQDRSYMLGMYTAAGQNNRAWKLTYATNLGIELGASGQPSSPGVSGRSSGHGYWRD